MIPLLLRWVLACVLATPAAALAQRISQADLGELELAYTVATTADEAPGPEVLFTAMVLPGDAFELHLPFRPNRFSRLVSAGHAVAAGAVIARVAGPELAAWLLEAEAVTAQFSHAEARFRSNRRLYDEGSLSGTQWKAISDAYYLLKQEMHHVEHVREVLRVTDEGDGNLVVADVLAPVGGRVTFPAFPAAGDSGVTVATFISPQALRLSGLLSQYARSGESPLALAIGACRIAVEQVEETAQSLTRRIWSEAEPNCLQLTPGVAYTGRLLYAFAGYVVPRAALLRAGGRPGILVRRGSGLEFIGVEIAAEDGASYFISADTSLTGAEILTRSVSAAQGLLLGLGRD